MSASLNSRKRVSKLVAQRIKIREKINILINFKNVCCELRTQIKVFPDFERFLLVATSACNAKIFRNELPENCGLHFNYAGRSRRTMKRSTSAPCFVAPRQWMLLFCDVNFKQPSASLSATQTETNLKRALRVVSPSEQSSVEICRN